MRFAPVRSTTDLELAAKSYDKAGGVNSGVGSFIIGWFSVDFGQLEFLSRVHAKRLY